MEIKPENTVAEIVSKKLGSDAVFNKYNIDFCCGGGITLETACKENGLNFEVLKAEIESINTKITGESINDLDVSSLIDIAKDNYHTYISDTIFEILPLSKKVAEVHGTTHPELIEINNLIISIEAVLTEMLKNSILSLYPIISAILNLENPAADYSIEQLQELQRAVKRNEIAQILIANAFKEIAKLSANYTVPKGGCNSYQLLYKKIQEFEHEIHKYIHLEKNVLIPKILKIIA
jgi:regulator of cell morphogenesis and NO signaling